MSDLWLSVFFLGALSALMRYSVRQGTDPLALNLTFRGTVVVYMLVPLLFKGEPVAPLAREVAGDWLWVVTSLSFWVAGIGSIKSVQLGPLGASWTILRCSMLVPVTVSILYLRELPLSPVSGLLVARLSGVALGLCTAALYGYSYHRSQGDSGLRPGDKRRWMLWAGTTFAAQGAWETCLLGARGLTQDASYFFLFLVFAGCFLLTIPLLAARRIRVRFQEVKYGALLGVCAMLGTTLRLDAIRSLGGTVVFPTTTVTGILFAQAAGRWIWRERLPNAGLGLAMGVAAVLLLTLRIG